MKQLVYYESEIFANFLMQ